ncbi:MAG: flagellar motor switch protein FliM [Planctomycetota bacterium]|nr:MAG: flagellar motor switch protein FliM [Planctomycetota bacterium]
MADVLDQSEVDAILAAVDAGQVETESAPVQVFSRNRRDLDDVEIRSYDFKRPERVSKDQMRALQTLHEAFARNFGASLSGFMRTIVEVKVATCEQMTYGEFTSALPNPTCFNLVECSSLSGQMCLELSPLIIYPMIDRLLGGSSHDLFIPQRPMTPIETRLISNVTRRALDTLSEAWEGVRSIKFEITSTESNPQLVQIVPPNEVVVVVGLEVKMSNRAGTMNLCIPYNAIEPVMAELSSQSWFSIQKSDATEEITRRLGEQLQRATTTVKGILAETTLKVSDLASLQVGDLILTEKPATAPIVVSVEGEKKFLATLGQYKGRRALCVQRAIRRSDRV